MRLRMPDRPSDRQLAPWEATLAQALQQDDPERTALEEIQAAQDRTTNTAHLLALSEAFWRLDVVPQIDQMVKERIAPAEYDRYLKDPEREAFHQALREHEIGGRRIEDVLDSITAAPLEGSRSIAAVLHGRAGKEPAPAWGRTTGWAERAAQADSAEIAGAVKMLDARQAELGQELAARPPAWALGAWGVPPSVQESAARRADWEKQAGIVAAYREAIGLTDPEQAIGPPPAGTAQVREAFRSAVRALELPDDAALMRAMGRGELEADVDRHDRALALAPADVQAEIDARETDLEHARERAYLAQRTGDAEAEATAEAKAEYAAESLARLAVADATRREWAEAHAGLRDKARAAETELQRRGLAERIPVTDDEVARAAQADRETPAMDPEVWAQLRAGQTAWLEGQRQAEAERMARLTPVTDAEIERYRGEPEADESPSRTEILADIHGDLQAIGDELDGLGRQAEAEQAQQRAEYQRYIEEAAPRPEASIQAEAHAEAEAEPEMEI